MAKRTAKPKPVTRKSTGPAKPIADAGIIRFEAVLEKSPGRFGWTFVEFPDDVEQRFGKRGAVRIKGTINGVPMDRALMPTKSGYHVIVLGGELRRQAKVNPGDRARFEVWLNKHPDELQLPEELQETLDFLPDFKAGWERVRPGMKRSILIWVNSGKTTATRAKRVAEILKRFETGHSWFKTARTAQPPRNLER